MKKQDILDLPIFPEYKLEICDREIKYSSSVYVHYEKEKCVEILLQPVISDFRALKRTNRQELLNNHLRSCLMISKYAIITLEHKELLPCIDTVFKVDEHFLDIIHNTYP